MQEANSAVDQLSGHACKAPQVLLPAAFPGNGGASLTCQLDVMHAVRNTSIHQGLVLIDAPKQPDACLSESLQMICTKTEPTSV